MGIMLEEHGEILLYGIVGILLVIVICSVCLKEWELLMPEYNCGVVYENCN